MGLEVVLIEKTNRFISHNDESKAGEALVLLSNRLSVVICTFQQNLDSRGWKQVGTSLESQRKHPMMREILEHVFSKVLRQDDPQII